MWVSGLGARGQKKSLCSLTSSSRLTCIHSLWPCALWCSSNSVNECHYLYETARGLSHHYEPSSSIQHGHRLGAAQQEASEPGRKQREVRVSLCPGDWSWNLGLLYRGSCSRIMTDCSPPSNLVVTGELYVNTCMIYTRLLWPSPHACSNINVFLFWI